MLPIEARLNGVSGGGSDWGGKGDSGVLPIDVAVGEVLEQLILADNEQTRSELQQLLSTWLVERDGMLVPPISEMVCAIVYWTR